MELENPITYNIPKGKFYKQRLFPRPIGYGVAAFIVFVLLVSLAFGWFNYYRIDQEAQSQAAINELQKKLSLLEGRVESVTIDQKETDLSVKELANRQQVKQKSQDDLLTAAVSKVAPAVVSIVISKDVPKLEVVYKNPFGDDPFFKDFGVRIPVYQQKGVERKKIGAGTGFIISLDGYIVTNRHVVADQSALYTALLVDGTQKEAVVVYRDDINDLAVIKITGSNFSSVSLGDSNSLQLGQTVVAIGNALGEYNNSVSVGIISGLDRKIQASNSQGKVEELSNIIQTDAGINPGNSGGPLIDLNGKVIGVNVATVMGSNSISFSIPINDVKRVIQRVLGK